jgi:hypothetical protein
MMSGKFIYQKGEYVRKSITPERALELKQERILAAERELHEALTSPLFEFEDVFVVTTEIPGEEPRITCSPRAIRKLRDSIKPKL